MVREKLSANGLFIANIAGSLATGEPSFTLSELKTFRSVFPNSYFFKTSERDVAEGQTIIFVGYKSDRVVDVASESKAFSSDFFQALPGHLIDVSRFDLASQILLSDDYAPVEYLTAAFVNQAFQRKAL